MRVITAFLLWAGIMFGQTPGNKGYSIQEIKDGLYWVSDGAYNTMFLVTSDGVIAVDALPTLAPRQKTLMLVDIIYPGYMPYKNLGIVEDVPGYIAAHQTVLGYDFETFVGGHVNRMGNRADVETSLEFTTQLYSLADQASEQDSISRLPRFPSRTGQVGSAQSI
jgi:hypothetical protein